MSICATKMKAEAIETIPNMCCNSRSIISGYVDNSRFWKIPCCAGTSSLQSSMLCKQFQVQYRQFQVVDSWL